MAEPALLELRRAVRSVLEPGRVLVAVSGGADSLALTGAACAEALATGALVGAVVVDHALQSDSARVASDAARAAESLGAGPVEIVRVQVGTDGGPEAAARAARYAALAAAARRHAATCVLLGHTREDQAETVLLGLGRGSGTRSLSGMADTTVADGVTFRRPLLRVARSVTRAACAELDVTPWEDPHNSDPSFRRVRVRTELLPALADVLGPGAVPALARSADLLREDADALDGWARRTHEIAASGDGLLLAQLTELPVAVRRRVLRIAALAAGVPAGSLTAAHLVSVDALVADWHGQGPVALPGAVSAERSYGRLTFRGR